MKGNDQSLLELLQLDRCDKITNWTLRGTTNKPSQLLNHPFHACTPTPRQTELLSALT